MSEVHKCPTTPYFTNTMKSSIFQSQCWKMKIRFWKIQNFVEKKLGDFFLRCKWPNMALGGDILQDLSKTSCELIFWAGNSNSCLKIIVMRSFLCLLSEMTINISLKKKMLKALLPFLRSSGRLACLKWMK